MEQQPKKRTNRSGIRKHGNRFQWSVSLDGKRYWGSCATQAEAKAARAAAINEHAKGLFVAPTKMTLKEYYEVEYLPSAKRGLKESTIKNYSDIWRWRIEPYLGDLVIGSITAGRVSSWLSMLEKEGNQKGGPLGSVSVKHAYTFLSVLLGHAVSHGVLAVNVCSKLEHKPTRDSSKHDRDWWTADILQEFLSDPLVIGHRNYGLVVFLFDTGCRRGEICGLRWSSVNLDTGRVIVERSRVRVSGVAIFEGPPKSRRGKPKTRTLDLSEPAIAALRAWKKLQAEERLKMGPGWKGTDYAFTGPVWGPGANSGAPYSPEGVAQAWGRLRDRWAKKWEAEHEGVTLPRPSIHEARHSYASVMIAAGEHSMVVAQRLGHADTRLVDSTYGHLSPTADKAAANRVAGLLHSANGGTGSE